MAPAAPARAARPQLWVFAGPNGAGKSTLAARFVRGRVPIVNPDVIARGLPARPDGTPDVLAAGRLAIVERERLLRARVSFAIETTLSGRGEVDFAGRAKAEGFELRMFFVGLVRVELSVERVALRVSDGGHDVPRPDLVRRFERSLANLPRIAGLADRLYVFENSGLRRRLVLARTDGRTRVLSRRVPGWLARALPPDLLGPEAEEVPER